MSWSRVCGPLVFSKFMHNTYMYNQLLSVTRHYLLFIIILLYLLCVIYYLETVLCVETIQKKRVMKDQLGFSNTYSSKPLESLLILSEI